MESSNSPDFESALRSEDLLQQKLNSLKRIIASARTLNNKRVFQAIVKIAQPDIACFYDLNQGKTQLEARAVYPKAYWKNPDSHRFRAWDMQAGAIGKAIREKASQLITDPVVAEERGEYIPYDVKIGSEIVVPILSGERIFGVLVLSRYIGNSFKNIDVTLVELAAEALALAYRNHEEKVAREQRVQFLNEISTLPVLDLDKALSRFLNALLVFLDSNFATLWLYNDLDDTMVIRAFESANATPGSVTFDTLGQRVLSVPGSPFEKVVKNPEPIEIPIELDNENSESSFALSHGFKYRLVFPILTSLQKPSRVYGVVNIYRTTPLDFLSSDAVNTASLLATRLADTISLSVVYQHDQISRYDRILREMVTHGELQRYWDEFASVTAELMQCEACSILMVDGSNALHLKGSTGLVGAPEYSDVRYGPNEGLTGTAYSQGTPIVYYDEYRERYREVHTSKFREILKTSDRSHSILLVPVRDVLGTTVGIIRCNNKDTSPTQHCGRFTREDVQRLTVIGELAFHTIFRAVWLMKRERIQQSYLDRLHHEVVSPLDGILNHMEWLNRKITAREVLSVDDRHLIERRTGDVIEAARLIDNIVKSIGHDRFEERIKPSFFERLSVSELVYTCRGWLQYAAKSKSVTIEISTIEASRGLYGDRSTILRVLYNLMMNAIKYSDYSERQRYLKISGRVTRGEYMVELEDNGIGIPLEHRSAVFQKGFRSDNAIRVFPEGSGFGLSYCRSIVEAHRGRIELAKCGNPTIFRVLLPLRSPW